MGAAHNSWGAYLGSLEKKLSKTYVGTRKGEFVYSVTVNGQRLHNYDPFGDPEYGFEWGYGGAGPYALAFSILCDHFGIDKTTDPEAQFGSKPYQRLRQSFKEEVIAQFPHDAGFTLTSEQITEWVAKKESESRTPTSPS
ncbi:MAG: DUF6166 domain-containing protein [Candidatus Levybacteria bacterium]|nr:DUF6166 domain-containing protein [Candidatus Levybacteria bacterium]